jgi:transposase InsO family protein
VTHQQAFQEIAKGAESKQVDSMQRGRDSSRSARTCTQCGEERHKSSQCCPARGTKCAKCGGENHWAKVCYSRTNSPYNSQSWSSYGNRGKGRGRFRGGCGNRGQGRERSGGHNKQFDNIEQDEDALDDFSTIAFDVINITVDTVKHETSAFATVNLRLPHKPVNDTLKLKVDTGAEGNILPLRTYRKMFPHRLDAEGFPRSSEVSHKPQTKLSAYNGSEIKQHGEITLRCQYRDSSWQTLAFYIAESEGPAILGLNSCKIMDIVSLRCDDIGIDICATHASKSTSSVSSVNDLIKMFPDSFDTLGSFPGEYHITVDPTVAPVVHAPRKYPIQLRQDIKDELTKMEAMGVITKVTEPTDWVSSLTFTQKRGGGLRVCLDPKDLNRAVKRAHHKTPTLEEITHQFSGAKVFSKLDAKNGCWSVKLNEPSSKLTTFQTPFGRYCFRRLPFGLVVSQDVFQQRMDAILEKCPGCTGITDDVAVFGKNEAEHDRNLLNLMQVAREHGLVFNSPKCTIKVPEISFFGNLYSAEGVKPDPERVAAINSLPPPENARELQEFLGIATYMAPFVPKLSHHSACLRGLLKKDAEYAWLSNHTAAFDEIKSIICRSTTLAYFDPNKHSVLQVDSSKGGLGAVLMQDGRPIAFASKSLSETETRYANIERELLAVVFGCERFHTYLYGKAFTVHSDHKPLEMIQLKNLHAAPPRLQRMLLRLQNYDVEIVYKPGKTLLLADGLSRLPGAPGEPSIELDVQVNLVQFSTERVQELRDSTASDTSLAPLRDVIISGWPETQKELPHILRPFWSYRDELSVEDGVVLKGSEQVMIPSSMQQYILTALHAGHQGRDKCRLRAKTSVYWNGMNKDIETFVADCAICQEHASSQQSEPLLQKDIPPRPWHTLSADFFDLDGEEYLLLVDHYTKFPFVRLMSRSCSSKATIDYLKETFGIQGIPEILYTDNGPQFSAHVFKQFAKSWSFQHITSSPRYAQSNGFIERSVQTVKNTMKKAKLDNVDRDLALLCLRTTPISNQIGSPMELLSKRKAKANLPVILRNECEDKDHVNDALESRQESQKFYYDAKSGKELPSLCTGQKVRFQHHVTGHWIPAKIAEKCAEPRSYILETPNGSRLRRNRKHLRELPTSTNDRIATPEHTSTSTHTSTPTTSSTSTTSNTSTSTSTPTRTSTPTCTSTPKRVRFESSPTKVVSQCDGYSRYGRKIRPPDRLDT